jgi:hypothetical protein
MGSLQMGVISIHHNMSFPKGLPNIGHMQAQTWAQEKPNTNTIMCFVWNMKTIHLKI